MIIKATIVAFFIFSNPFLIANCDLGTLYDGYKLLSLAPGREEQVLALKELQASGVVFPASLSATIHKKCDILVSPLQMEMVLSVIKFHGMEYEEKIPDVGQFIRSQRVINGTNNGRLTWDAYYTLDAITEYLEAQVAQHSQIASLINIGNTFENRNLTLIKIASGPQPKPIIYIESNIHAREWITGAVATHIIDQLLNGPDAVMQSYVDRFDFYILPIANPDGFEYTHTVDRFWRKTRSSTPSPIGCRGADPNRNFEAYWMENGGGSADPCSNTYAGHRPFSEPECQSMANFMLEPEINNNIVMFLSLHSAGQYLLIPTGLNEDKIPEYDDYMLRANDAALAHTNVFGKNYTAGSIYDLMYPATGSSMDWAYLNVDASFHVTYELRDKGQYGHLLPPDQILPSCVEFLAGFKVLLSYL